MALISGHAYPSLGHIKEDCRALRIISPAYAGREGELTAVLQYVYQSVLLGSLGDSAARLFSEIAAAEMRHLEILGTLITKLGAPPVFTSCPPYPVGYYSASCVNYTKSLPCMLDSDIRAERAAIESYDRMLGSLHGDVADVIARVREDELLHLSALKSLRTQTQTN